MSQYDEIMKIVNKELELEKRERAVNDREKAINKRINREKEESQEDEQLKAVAKAMGLKRD